MKLAVIRSCVRLFATALTIGPAIAQSTQPVEWKVSEGGNGHWYSFDPTTRLWPNARDEAALRGGHMATITSSAEQSFAKEMCPASTWIGGVQPAGSCEPDCGWAWITGEPWNFTAWRPGEPNNLGQGDEPYLSLEGQTADGGWNDGPPYGMSALLIEWDADCNSDGIADYGQIRRGLLADFNGNLIPDCCERGQDCTLGNFPVEWKVSEGGNGHWYSFDPTTRLWPNARDEAALRGGHMATITSSAEQSFAKEMCPASTWIGGVQPAGSCEPDCGWAWITGEPWNFTAWRPGEPNNLGQGDEPYLSLEGQTADGGWNDGPPYGESALLIEWDADCNGDSTTDYGQILSGELLDRDEDAVPDECQCQLKPGLPICCTADLDLNGEIGASDISLLLLSFGEPRWAAPAFDLDGDGTVGGGDISIVLLDFGACPNLGS